LAQKSLQSILSRQSSWHVQARDSTRMIFDGLKFVCALAALMPASNEQARIATIATTLERLVMTAASFF
jgi:hypothetical protein